MQVNHSKLSWKDICSFNFKHAYLIKNAILIVLVFLLMRLVGFENEMISFIIMFGLAVFSYFYISIKNKDFFDFRAIFLAAWLVSFALNLIRLNPIYNELSLKTSIVLIVTPVTLLLGSFLYEIMHNKQTEGKVNPRVFMDSKLFFAVSLLISVFILGCFIAESIIIGELPYFSSDMNAYVTFYVSGLHQFVVLSYFVPCLAIIYIHQYGVKWYSPKALLLIALSLISYAIPILIVSRQLLLQQLFVMFFTLAFYHRKRTFQLFIAMVLCFGWAFVFLSGARNQSEEYLADAYTQSNKQEEDSSEEASEDSETIMPTQHEVAFDLPSVLVTPYVYFSNSLQSFNNQVNYQKKYYYGVSLLELPVKAWSKITGTEVELMAAYKHDKARLQISPFLNTFGFVSDFYFDFGIFGVIVGMALYGYVLSWLKHKSLVSQNPFIIMLSGLFVYACLFSFFIPWLSNSTLQYTVVFLVLLAFWNTKIKNKVPEMNSPTY
ncbi:O-antigen ligase [Trichococcus sp. K1Tr]|uniref:O-antigen polymerase n=1 Tax=Trichococcus sp. K1Tr TaxID=3020847 RepID=UPI00233147CD|nr:O-antigen polymerase [Trichococcus sp. K1Tr]MDB6354117.1 O-antigen ligase [Trichococcus sp. K1Tr]